MKKGRNEGSRQCVDEAPGANTGYNNIYTATHEKLIQAPTQTFHQNSSQILTDFTNSFTGTFTVPVHLQ